MGNASLTGNHSGTAWEALKGDCHGAKQVSKVGCGKSCADIVLYAGGPQSERDSAKQEGVQQYGPGPRV